MSYLSDDDRRAERESAEERRVGLFAGLYLGPTCPWCRQPVTRHRPGALSRCEDAYRTDLYQRLASGVSEMVVTRERNTKPGRTIPITPKA